VPASTQLPPGYCLQSGSSLDRALLLKFMQRAYTEIIGEGQFAHLSLTIDSYLSTETPLWWVELDNPTTEDAVNILPGRSLKPIACLWLGVSIDQIHGDRHANIFLLYVAPEHRRKGIATALMQLAEAWARQRGDRQIALQVFQVNKTAFELYQALGYKTQSLWMVKPLNQKKSD